MAKKREETPLMSAYIPVNYETGIKFINGLIGIREAIEFIVFSIPYMFLIYFSPFELTLKFFLVIIAFAINAVLCVIKVNEDYFSRNIFIFIFYLVNKRKMSYKRINAPK